MNDLGQLARSPWAAWESLMNGPPVAFDDGLAVGSADLNSAHCYSYCTATAATTITGYSYRSWLCKLHSQPL